MSRTNLLGLAGTNPLGFLAALGVQVLFEAEEQQPRLWWSDDVIPYAVVDPGFPVERITEQASTTLPAWSRSPALRTALKPVGDVKFGPEDLRTYLESTSARDPGNSLAAALVAERSLDRSGVAKPTDLYFTAGKQLFLVMAEKILEGATEADIGEALIGPWSYASDLPSLMWDVVDDRNYALAAYNPAGEKKLTNPGAEALAILGMSRYPVFAGKERTVTPGCAGRWKVGSFTWPLWSVPAGSGSVKSLLAHASTDSTPDRLPGWGVSHVLRSAIRRSDQGGYGTFGPAAVLWSAMSS